jgi:hypothetical protein
MLLLLFDTRKIYPQTSKEEEANRRDEIETQNYCFLALKHSAAASQFVQNFAPPGMTSRFFVSPAGKNSKTTSKNKRKKL